VDLEPLPWASPPSGTIPGTTDNDAVFEAVIVSFSSRDRERAFRLRSLYQGRMAPASKTHVATRHSNETIGYGVGKRVTYEYSLTR
jgi:hypothetical protein